MNEIDKLILDVNNAKYANTKHIDILNLLERAVELLATIAKESV